MSVTVVAAPPSDILRAASEAFAEHGYHGATVRDVAARAGISVPGLYHHHASKQDLLRAILESSAAEIVSRSRAALAESEPDPRRQLDALVRTLVRFVAERRDLAMLQAEARYLDTENWRSYVALRDAQETLVSEVVADGVRSGAFTCPAPAADVTRALHAMCIGIAGWYRPDGPLTPDQLADQYVDLSRGLVGAVAPPSPSSPQGVT